MAVQKPLVFSGTRIQRLPPGDTIEGGGVALIPFTNNEGSTIAIGQPVFVSGEDNVGLARANPLASSRAIGLLASSSVADGAEATVQTNGVLEATTGEWDAVTGGTGGLSPGMRYFVDPDTAGMMTTTPPTEDGDVLVEMGIAKSSTEFFISIKRLIQL